MEHTAWDLEIAQEIPEGTEDWRELGDLGVSCWAGLGSGKGMVWYGGDWGGFTSQMTKEEIRESYDWLKAQPKPLVTWNGAGFDFPMLAKAGGISTAEIKDLVLDHVDLGFLMLCQKGFMIGLDACAKALGLEGKTEGMSGALAPRLWNGKGQVKGYLCSTPRARRQVLNYVIQDTLATSQTYLALVPGVDVYWTTKKGTKSKRPWRSATRNGELLTVRQALELKKVDTSWMTDPRGREQYVGWLDD